MKLKYFLTALVFSFILFLATASAADRKPRRTSDRKTETVLELTERGVKLGAAYAKVLESRKAEIDKALPSIDEGKIAAWKDAIKAEEGPAKLAEEKANEVAKLRGRERELSDLENKVKYVPKMLADAEARLEKALALPDDVEGKAEAVDNARKKIALRNEH